MESTIQCEYEYDKKVSFALQQNHVPVIKFLVIKNRSEETLSNVRIEITSNPNFCEPYSQMIQELEAGEIIEIRPDLILSSEYLSALEEKMTGFLKLTIKADERELHEERLPIDVLSYDAWPGTSVLPEIIAGFVTPNRPYIMKIIKQASVIMENKTGSS